LAAGAARRRSGRCKDAGKRGCRSDSPVGNKQQGRKQQRVCNDSVLPFQEAHADEEDDDYNNDERGDDDNIVTTYTADIAIVDKENDHKDEESEDEEGDNSAAKELQVMVRNQRQRSSVSIFKQCQKCILRYEEACSAGGGRNTDKRIDGKYTSSVKGHAEFGGGVGKVSRDSMLCVNWWRQTESLKWQQQ
jgi:hypothetical protein